MLLSPLKLSIVFVILALYKSCLSACCFLCVKLKAINIYIFICVYILIYCHSHIGYVFFEPHLSVWSIRAKRLVLETRVYLGPGAI